MAEYVDDEAVADEAARCPVPALFLHGSEDPRPADGARSLAGIVPHARFTSVAGAGHLPWVEHPDVVHREIVDFLSAKP